ncbi:unnamed protein product [Adineta ricciae]|uniref:Helix-turn-helix domain-containing protein n=1 Tax=Adineta ricciae TaxID=249248 RepID=A0A816ADP1_ADIRI|nr:unnamed protein product [Adineta ricciae]CAF1596111.1 unnamed protein product [Adineta ricciae]
MLHGYRKLKGVPIDAIRKLARLFITENVFTYEKKFYRQVVRGAIESAFTSTLANIFMCKWEKEFSQRQASSNEIYDQRLIIFTQTLNWRATLDAMCRFWLFLSKTRMAPQQHQFIIKAAELYVVQFTSNHSKHVFGNIINTALWRAVQYSSTLAVFDDEQQFVKLMLLYNGYPPRFIYAQFNRFANQNRMDRNVVDAYHSEKDFIERCHELLNKTTIQGIAIQSNIFKASCGTIEEFMSESAVQFQKTGPSKWDSSVIIY